MENRRLLYVVLALVIIVGAAVAAGWSTAKPCTSVAVSPGIDSQCPAGGTYCASSEGQHCSGTWPLRKHCKTNYSPNGTCSCLCQ